MAYTQQQVSQLRDKKVREIMQAQAPIWLVNEQFRSREDSLLFSLVYQDPSYGWMSRRYKFDAFNDVLYHLGWHLFSEEEALKIQEAEPYIDGEVAVHVPNAPGSRAAPSQLPFIPR